MIQDLRGETRPEGREFLDMTITILPLITMLAFGVAILLLLLKGLTHTLSGTNEQGDQMSREEVEMIQEIYRTLERLERRIEPLEDRLFDRERAERNRERTR